jgi:serine/threonine protein kinase
MKKNSQVAQRPYILEPEKIDIFQLGVSLLNTVSGTTFFKHASPTDPVYGLFYSDNSDLGAVENRFPEKLKQFIPDIDESLSELICSLIQPDPIRRPTAKAILQSNKWLTSYPTSNPSTV